MTWTWDQSAGEIRRDGVLVGKGYSGHDLGKNNPDMQDASNVGPIPRGQWKITDLRATGATTGPFTIVLAPCDGTDTCGRSEFRIHGDSISNPGGASHGCIILPRKVRDQISDSGDRQIQVVCTAPVPVPSGATE